MKFINAFTIWDLPLQTLDLQRMIRQIDFDVAHFYICLIDRKCAMQ